MGYKRKNPINPLLPVDYRGKAGIALTGNRVYNGASRAPNPAGRNQHAAINNQAKQQLAKNKAKLMANRRRISYGE